MAADGISTRSVMDGRKYSCHDGRTNLLDKAAADLSVMSAEKIIVIFCHGGKTILLY
jgi:hypothetical protein